jgi:hypothetical protein
LWWKNGATFAFFFLLQRANTNIILKELNRSGLCPAPSFTRRVKAALASPRTKAFAGAAATPLVCPMRAGVEKLQDRLAYPPRLMDEVRAAAYVGFGTTKFGELVDEGIMPSPVNIDGSPRWDCFELDGAVDNLKDRRRDPVTRDHDRLEQRIRAMEEGEAS